MMEKNERVVFEVRMLGGFHVFYKGTEIILGRKSTLKFIQMLQIVWLRGKKGIAKEQLAKALYGERDISNVNNSVNNLLYQLRRQLVKLGLPDGEYIILSNHRYVEDPEFPVKLDVRDFEQEVALGDAQKDEIKKHKHYRAAFDIYQGELLPLSSTENWVISASIELKKSFEKIIVWLVDYYNRERNLNDLEMLYERAVELYPYDNWQIGQIDLLVEKKEYKQAIALYDKTVHEYAEEFGVPPTPEMEACYQRITEKLYHDSGDIDEVVWNMVQSSKREAEENGAYYCSYRSFVDICQMVSRSSERTNTSMNLTLCTMVDYEGKIFQDKEKQEEYSDAVRSILRRSLRKSDVITRYSHSQFLLLLVGTQQEYCEIIYHRINQKMRMEFNNRVRLRYIDASPDQLFSTY